MLRNKLITCFRKCTVSYGNVILIIWCLLSQYISAWSELFYLFTVKNGVRHLRGTFLGPEFSLFLIGSSFNQT